MDLYEAITTLTEPGCHEIPDCSRDDIPGLCLRMGLRCGVEVGVARAHYTEKFAAAGLEIIGVDPWGRRRSRRPTRNGEPGGRREELYQMAVARLAPYPNARLIRKTSMEAVEDFGRSSIDFVYVDGHHGFAYVAEDLWHWSQRVRPGGLIMGHDYDAMAPGFPRDLMTCHVRFVVDAWVQAVQIPCWYVLGRRGSRGRERCDKWRSFLWLQDDAHA